MNAIKPINYNQCRDIVLNCLSYVGTPNLERDEIIFSTLPLLGLDSLDQVELIMEIEKEAAIGIPDTEAEILMNGQVNQLILWLCNRLK